MRLLLATIRVLRLLALIMPRWFKTTVAQTAFSRSGPKSIRTTSTKIEAVEVVTTIIGHLAHTVTILVRIKGTNWHILIIRTRFRVVGTIISL